ncbi:rhomboid family intramembrane serine protease [Pacificoceanicola onchidii]|uniref:rhomboid family intramembrane serine protease n=1 Tax=Pacificoceanicola onchidii TaxID=2562685 RepID=UPI0010A6ACEB|nr:rhomboid family intramembrane serine protease [Pacificoceanicola onchidii]
MTGPPPVSKTKIAPERVVWLGLALVFCAVEAALIAADLRLLGSPLWRPLAYQYGGFWAGLLYGWQANYAAQPYAMFLSYMVLHAGWQHMLGNVLALGWLGLQLEGRIGGRRLAMLFLISGLGGAVGFGLLSTSPRPMVGASGAIMGLVAVWIALDARDRLAEGASGRAVRHMVLGRTALVAVLNLLASVLEAGGLAWETHLGGFVAAAVVLAVMPGMRSPG